jgi:hypothetical protein
MMMGSTPMALQHSSTMKLLPQPFLPHTAET